MRNDWYDLGQDKPAQENDKLEAKRGLALSRSDRLV